MAQYVLYHFQWSLFSLMARYTIALQGNPSSETAEMYIEGRSVNLHQAENLSERYLLEVNPKGQVPALASASLPHTLTNTLEITRLIGESYPSLFPSAHRSIINSLLEELHAIQPLSLSVPSLEDATQGNVNPSIQEHLSRPDISDAWRTALLFKEDYHNKTLLRALDKDSVKHAEDQARNLFKKVSEQYSVHGSSRASWLFGDSMGATALDAHIVPFIGRLIDAAREDLVPIDLLRYAKNALGGKEWQSVTNGKLTLFKVWLANMRKEYETARVSGPFGRWFKRRM